MATSGAHLAKSSMATFIDRFLDSEATRRLGCGFEARGRYVPGEDVGELISNGAIFNNGGGIGGRTPMGVER